jgi:hypothetical protein
VRSWNAFRIHKWLAVGSGGFILLWLVSGVAMVMPVPWAERNPAPGTFDPGRIALAPAAVAARLRQPGRETVAVDSIVLRRLGSRVVYHVSLADGSERVLDAETAAEVVVTQAAAAEIARAGARGAGRIADIRYLERRSFEYLTGPRPAYRIVFEDEPTVYFVTRRDGRLERVTAWSTVVGVLGRLHTFEPLNRVFGRGAARRVPLVVVGLLGVAAAVSGYYIAYARR